MTCGPAVTNENHLRRIINLVERRVSYDNVYFPWSLKPLSSDRFSFAVGLMSPRIDSSTMRQAFIPLIRDLFNRFYDKEHTVWSQISRWIQSTAIAKKSSILFVYRPHTSRNPNVRELFDPSVGIWGVNDPVYCPAIGCGGELIVSARNKKQSLVFSCLACKRHSARLCAPSDIYPVERSSLYTRTFPPAISVEHYIWKNWKSGDGAGRTLPVGDQSFPRKIDPSRVPGYQETQKPRKMKASRQCLGDFHGSSSKHVSMPTKRRITVELESRKYSNATYKQARRS